MNINELISMIIEKDRPSGGGFGFASEMPLDKVSAFLVQRAETYEKEGEYILSTDRRAACLNFAQAIEGRLRAQIYGCLLIYRPEHITEAISEDRISKIFAALNKHIGSPGLAKALLLEASGLEGDRRKILDFCLEQYIVGKDSTNLFMIQNACRNIRFGQDNKFHVCRLEMRDVNALKQRLKFVKDFFYSQNFKLETSNIDT